jgi:predicted nucleotidyltransferase
MRLTDEERQVLRDAAARWFGPAAQVRVFGSRLDDTRRGGDIDLLVETTLQDPATIVDAHLPTPGWANARPPC